MLFVETITDKNKHIAFYNFNYMVFDKDCKGEKSHRACQQIEPLRAQRQSTTLESLHLLPPGDIQVVPAPWPSAHCLPDPAVDTKQSIQTPFLYWLITAIQFRECCVSVNYRVLSDFAMCISFVSCASYPCITGSQPRWLHSPACYRSSGDDLR